MKAFVISMETPQGRERLAKMRERCAREGIEFEHVPGVDGKTLSREDLKALATPRCEAMCTPAMMGCALSHISCWQRLRDSPTDEMFLILEDDAVLVEGFVDKMHAALRDVPDGWHVLLLGCFLCNPDLQDIASGGTAARHGCTRDISAFSGTHAYIISKAGAAHMLDGRQGRVDFHIDIQMHRTPGARIYAVDEDLAIQEDMSTSSTASFGFPGSINAGLSKIKNSKNVCCAYIMNGTYMRLGQYGSHVEVTPWWVVLLVLGIAGFPWQWLAIFVAVDTALFPPRKPVDTLAKTGAFVLGMGMRRSFGRP